MDKRGVDIENRLAVEDILLLKKLLNRLTEDSSYDFLKPKKDFVRIPVCVFSNDCSPLETVSYYLRENKGLSFGDIARSLKTSYKAVWLAYSNARKKFHRKFSEESSEFDIPLQVFHEKLSVLESVSLYLKHHHRLSFRRIGTLLDRDERTVWTVINRANTKLEHVKH